MMSREPSADQGAKLHSYKKSVRGTLWASFIGRLAAFQYKLAARHLRDGRRQMAVFSFDYIGVQIGWYGLYEKDDLTLIFDWLRPFHAEMKKAVAIDVGANIGNHSLFFSDYFAAVYAFEPHPRTFRLLELNSEGADNVHCRMLGLSDTRGEAVLAEDRLNAGRASVCRKPDSPDQARLIHLDTGDSALQGVDDIFLIKVDVEGLEPEVLKGCAGILARCQPVILFEQNADALQDGEPEAVSFLAARGYSFAIVRQSCAEGKSNIAMTIVNYVWRLLKRDEVSLQLVDRIPPDRGYSMVVAIPPRVRDVLKIPTAG